MRGTKVCFFTALLRDRRGNILPMAAIGLLLTAALVGGGIDMSRAYRVENRLQAACDAGVLAGRRAVASAGYDATAQNQATSYFNSNFDYASMEATSPGFMSTSADNGQTVTGSANVDLNMALMKIFGFQKFNLSVTCEASMGVGNSDVVMVLDTTGSMGSTLGSGTRISALRTAMKNFYTTVKTATQGTNARIRYGFVPYSSTVNVGRLLYAKNPDWLRDTWTIQSRLAVQDGAVYTDDDNVRNGSKSNYTSTTYGSSYSCNNALPANTPWTNNGSESNLGTTDTTNNGSGDQRWTTTVRQPQERTVYECYSSNGSYRRRYYTQTKDYDTNTNWKWDYKQVGYDVTSYKAFSSVTTNTGSYGGTVNSTWAGCIEERGSTAASSFSYSTTTGLSPSAAQDLDIDSAPTTDDTSKWAPMWPEVAYHRYSNSQPTLTGYRASSYCPYRAQLLAEMTQSNFNAYADAMNAEGSTYLDIGMVWGGRISSPTGMFSDTVNVTPNNGGEVSRHIIFMTDGIMEPNNDIQSAWGIEYHDRRVTGDGSSNDASRHTARFRAICDQIKAKGIRVWTISFTSGTNSDLTYCASANSSYNANDASELNAAFQEIAKQVGELRLTQ